MIYESSYIFYCSAVQLSYNGKAINTGTKFLNIKVKLKDLLVIELVKSAAVKSFYLKVHGLNLWLNYTVRVVIMNRITNLLMLCVDKAK